MSCSSVTRIIKLSKDFCAIPGCRYRTDGRWSGEEFLEDVLIPALLHSDKVVIDFDDTIVVPSSFLDEAFGGVVRRLGPSVTAKLIFVATRKPTHADRARNYVQSAVNEYTGTPYYPIAWQTYQ